MANLKKLSKELVLAIDWAAAEYKYLEELKGELKIVEAETEIKKELKELKKAAKMLHYVSRAERRAYQFEEDTKRNLVELVPELEEHGISLQIILGFRDLTTELRIEHDQLVKLASFYDSTLEKELDKARVEADLEAKLNKEHPKQAQQMHQAFLELVHHFSREVEQAERWIQGLEASLKKGKKLVSQLIEVGHKNYVNSARLTQLWSLGFPVWRYPREAEIIVTIPETESTDYFYFLVRDIPMNRSEGNPLAKKWLPHLAKAGLISNFRLWQRFALLCFKATQQKDKHINLEPFLEEFLIFLVRLGAINRSNWEAYLDKLEQMGQYCEGSEYLSYGNLIHLRMYFSRSKFGIDIFDLLVFPTLKRQKEASYLYFNDYLFVLAAVRTKEDLAILITILNKRKFKAHDFFRNVVIPGIKTKTIPSSLSEEKEYLFHFMDNCSIDIFEIYVEYKRLLVSNFPDKMERIEKIVKDLRHIKQDIFKGILSKDYPETILGGVLFSVFGPELTVARQEYSKVYSLRTDHQSDIPSVLDKISPQEVSISMGGFGLREGEQLNTQAWKDLVEVVAEVHASPPKIIEEILGLELLRAFSTKHLAKDRREYLKKVYAAWHQLGNSLPEFTPEHTTLTRYKEFVGDRLKNDLITSLLDAAYTKQREAFTTVMKNLGKTQDLTGLAKQLFNLYSSKTENKEAKIKAILEKNGIHTLFDIQPQNWQEIKSWLEEKSTSSISKDLISSIFAMIIGEDYNKMQKEMDKFEHSHQATGKGGKKYIFMLSKRKVHSIAMFNMGVCVAPDETLWNSQDFWQLIIWDEDFYAHGGVIYRTIEEQGKKYLILSINPASSILNTVSPIHLYDQLIAFSERMRTKLGYDQILIPEDTAIHSNRGSIQAIISQRNYPKKKLHQIYDFSYSPYHYQYQEFFIVS